MAAAYPYATQIDAAARGANVPAPLLAGLVYRESSFDAGVVSKAGAIGLGQLMPDTARQLGVNPWDAADNLKGAASYLASLIRGMGGNVTNALAGYNAGGHAVQAGTAPASSFTYAANVQTSARGYGWDGKTLTYSNTGGGASSSSISSKPPAASQLFVLPIPVAQLTDPMHSEFNVGTHNPKNNDPYSWEDNGIDLHAKAGTPVHAPFAGKVSLGSNTLGGNTFHLTGANGLSAYGAHLEGYPSGLKSGATVKAGDVIGYVGTTGNAPKDTPHLHLSFSLLDTAVDPFLLLKPVADKGGAAVLAKSGKGALGSAWDAITSIPLGPSGIDLAKDPGGTVKSAASSAADAALGPVGDAITGVANQVAGAFGPALLKVALVLIGVGLIVGGLLRTGAGRGAATTIVNLRTIGAAGAAAA